MNWDEYYISLAWAVSKKSKDPSTQVGCVIVSENNEPISFGYNGFITKCDETYMSFEKPYKDMLTIHAEMNALIFAKCSLKNSKVYCTHVSCENCMKHLIQAGVKEIIYEKLDTNGNFINGDRKNVIERLIKSTGLIVRNFKNGKTFLEEVNQ